MSPPRIATSHGLTLGYHNHSAELRPVDGRTPLDRLAGRVDPSVAFQLDIFWVVVGGAEPAAVIDRLGERVVSLHVKDGVTLPSDAASGEPFLNVPIGEGIVDPRPAIAAADAHDGIEWLIVEFDHVAGDPLDAVGRELRLPDGARPRSRPHLVTEPFTAVRPARVGIVGCGNVTGLYLPGCARFPSIELAACADRDPARAAALAERGGFPAMSIDALLADPSIEIVLNLTPPTAHAGVTRAAIAAGKHVYTEKPFATDRADARAILAEADAAGVRIGGAPDTFLGAGLQTARAVLDAGTIGEVGFATAAVAHLGPERWHPDPDLFYAPGGGPLLDMGPYYVTTLVHLLGPIATVAAIARGAGGERRIGSGPRAGETVPVAVPTTVIASLTFASGAIGSLIASFDAAATELPHFELQGTRGSLVLGDPNWFDGSVRVHGLEGDWTDVPFAADPTIGRGIGLADLIEAIRLDRPARASGGLAFHVLDVLLAIEDAAATGRPIDGREPRGAAGALAPLNRSRQARRRSVSSIRSMSSSVER